MITKITHIVAEEDCCRGGYCIECFNPPTNNRNKLYFYNGDGPLCSKNCFADYKYVDVKTLPTIEWKGMVR